MRIPTTQYTQSGDVNIAYSVLGDGPRDLVLALGWVTHLEYMWEEPAVERMLRKLASFSRLIMFDKRGVGMSDRVAGAPPLEVRMDDLRAVMDATGSKQAALLGVSEGAAMSILFSATYPDRVSALILVGGYASLIRDAACPWGATEEEFRAASEFLVSAWGKPVFIEAFSPSLVGDERYKKWWGTYLRMAASPGAVRDLERLYPDVDVRHVLSAIRVPTLVVHRTGDKVTPVEAGRYLAEQIPDAKLVELPGDDHLPWSGNGDEILDEVEEFLTGERHHAERDRVLATVLFTDIVNSTRGAVTLGDRTLNDLLTSHNAIVRRDIARFRGREVRMTSDGVLATFDGPARAVRCAMRMVDELRKIGIEIRAGLHTGECEIVGDDIAGISVHTGARVSSLAKGGEVLVSSTVKDLVAGSGIVFADRGTHALEGVPGEWRMFAVAGYADVEGNLGKRTPAESDPNPSERTLVSRAPASKTFAAGRYTVRRMLGEGGQKIVYLVHDQALDRDCALSMVKAQLLAPDDLERLRREAQAMARLGAHTNIVTVHDLGEEDGHPYVVCEYVPGGDLRTELHAASEGLPLERALAIATDVCRALTVAHARGVVHRDIKPANIWLTEDGAAKLGDFGLAFSLDRSRLTMPGTVMGTAAYLSPEQALGEPVTERSDLYALGCLLYELVCGRPPFADANATAVIAQHLNAAPAAPSSHHTDVPPVLEDLILRLLSKSPAQRPESASAVLDQLRRIGDSLVSKTLYP